MSQRKDRPHFLTRAFFLDVFFDRQTRPILIYTICVIGIGAALYHGLEGWSWLDSFYFVVITLTTIGYGDLYPTTPATKIITILFALNGIVLILMLFDIIRRLRGWEIGSVNEKDEREAGEKA